MPASETSTSGVVWIRTTPASHHTYRPTLEIDGTTHDLGGGVAFKHALAVIEAAARAEYDAAVFRQMGGTATKDQELTDRLEMAARLVSGMRAERLAIDWPTPLTLEPGVSVFTGEPFLHISVNGQTVGQWTTQDASGHALGALQAASTADLDGDYLRTLMAHGVNEATARVIVAGEHVHPVAQCPPEPGPVHAPDTGEIHVCAEADRLRAELAAVKADPQAYLADDGTVTVEWPEGAVSCLVTRELLDKMVAERNKLTFDLEIVSTSSVGAHALLDDAQAEVERQQGLVGEALDLALRYLPPAAPPDPGRDPEGMAELLRIKREAGLTS